jgi:RNA polymerase sigma-70 factor, ECF subfamily
MTVERSLNEQQLILQLKEGRADAAGGLMDLHGESLMRYLHSILASHDAAEDAFQESWIKVMEKIDKFDNDFTFASWLFRIARNVAYDALRKKRRWWQINYWQEVSEYNELEKEIADPTDWGRRIEDSETAARLLELLPPEFREVLFLRFFHDQSYGQIAAQCHLPLGTVKSRLKRGLDFLAKNIKEGEIHA